MNERRTHQLVLVALSVPVILYRLSDYSLVNGDEGIYHQMARRMVETGDWWTLEYTGEARIYDTFTHAPLFLWAKAVVIAVFGDSYTTMRAPSAIFAVLSLLASYALVARLETPRAGLFAGLAQLTTFQFVYFHSARTGEMEPALMLLFTLAAVSFLRALSSGGGFVAHHLCLVGLMGCKLGVVAIPILAEAAYFSITPNARSRLRDWVVTALWVIPLGLLWHVVQLTWHWDLVGVVIDDLMAQTGASGGFRRELGIADQIAYYARQLLFGAYPYSLLYPVAIAGVFVGSRESTRSALALPALLIAATVAFFLSIAIHYPWYLHPALPFLSAFLGIGLDRMLRTPAHAASATSDHWAIHAAIALTLAVTAWIALPVIGFNPFADRVATLEMPLAWASPLGVGPVIGVPALGAALAWALLATRKQRLAVAVRGGLAVVVFGVALVRVLAPLAYADHRSENEILRARIDAARHAGEPLEWPIFVDLSGRLKARYYFGDDFRIAPVNPRERAQGHHFKLLPRVQLRPVQPPPPADR